EDPWPPSPTWSADPTATDGARSPEPSPPSPPSEPGVPSEDGEPAVPSVPAPAGPGTVDDGAPDPSATPAPAWLGTRALAAAGAGPVAPQDTPAELLDRRILTPDLLPPPADGTFAPTVGPVPADVLARSTWQPGCPVAADDLRYLTVQHHGFDGRLHTGEVVVHEDGVDAVLAVFGAMHAEGFPLEEVRVIRADELDAAPTGDGNVTSAFVCRQSVGGGRWSRHAYGLALDVNPFHNPYDRGSGDDRVVLPELATAYTDRSRELPGMLTAGSAAVRAADEAGWGWGGRWSSAKDWMHLSDDGS
ncbi:M15 family metallopeptidase, partial [Aquipuribacter hungaricus]